MGRGGGRTAWDAWTAWTRPGKAGLPWTGLGLRDLEAMDRT